MKKVRSKLRPTEIGVIKTFSLSPDDEVGEIAVECTGATYYYNNLAELCEKWEDAPEEPKGYWGIDYTSCRKGGIEEFTYDNDNIDEFNKSIGNYFETKEEAVKAVEKLKAWQRLKDKGFRFEYWTYKMDEPKIENHTHFMIVGVCEDGVRFDDLDLLFGGK